VRIYIQCEPGLVTRIAGRGRKIMSLTIESVTPSIGGIVHGVDLSQDMDDASFRAIEAGLMDRQVLFFRGQNITPEQQRDFAARFGPLHIHPIYPRSDRVPEIMILDTALNDLRDNALWHSDVSFSKTPPLGAVLVARKVPQTGGDTLWASATAAHDGLPEALKRLLEGLTATNDLAKSFPVERFGTTEASLTQLEKAKRDNPPVSHPVIRMHPVTGRRAIFVNEGFTTRIDGLDADSSDTLLNLLYRHVTRPEYTVRWRWRQGDVAVWDNRVTQHYATDDYRPHHRIMHRATIIGDRPV
jgi:taurine dioxygenase